MVRVENVLDASAIGATLARGSSATIGADETMVPPTQQGADTLQLDDPCLEP